MAFLAVFFALFLYTNANPILYGHKNLTYEEQIDKIVQETVECINNKAVPVISKLNNNDSSVLQIGKDALTHCVTMMARLIQNNPETEENGDDEGIISDTVSQESVEEENDNNDSSENDNDGDEKAEDFDDKSDSDEDVLDETVENAANKEQSSVSVEKTAKTVVLNEPELDFEKSQLSHVDE